jgi:hypothetical protein
VARASNNFLAFKEQTLAPLKKILWQRQMAQVNRTATICCRTFTQASSWLQKHRHPTNASQLLLLHKQKHRWITSEAASTLALKLNRLSNQGMDRP